LDGSVANFHFEAKELGYRLSDSEMDEFKRSRYGDVRGRQSNLAESPAQLLLEQASAKQSAGKKGSSVAQPSQVPSKVSAVAQPFQASSNVSAVVPNRAPAVQSQKAPTASPEDDKQTAGPTSDDVNKVNQLSSPVKQREYRRPDGRKRIIPEAVGIPSNQDNIPNCSQNQVVDFSSLDQRMNGKRPSYGSSGNCNNCEVRDHSGVTARVNITESLVIQKASTIAGNDGRPSIEHTGSVVPGSLTSCSALSIHVQNNDNEDSIPVCLEAKPVERAAGDMIGVDGAFSTKESEIKCTRGTETLWFDRISGKVTVLAGNANFWAVGSEDGCLQVSSIIYQSVSYKSILVSIWMLLGG
jgi:protein HIRA/HIR1